MREGKPIRLIAREPGLSRKTAKIHGGPARRALAATTCTQAIVVANRMGPVLGE